ncbi:hypothetical protein [Nocardia gipuzkoensis]
MQEEELRALPVMVSFENAYKALGISRAPAYKAAQTGEFPIPLRRVGNRYKAAKGDILRYLGYDTSVHGVTTPPATGDSDDGMSPVVKTRSGRVVEPERTYRFNGRQWDGSEIIAVARLLGVA